VDNESQKDAQSTGGSKNGLRYALVLAVLGLVVAAGVYLLLHRQKAPPPVAVAEPERSPILHTRVNDIPADTPTVLIGLQSKGHVLLDASTLCQHPLFRERTEITPTTATATEASFVATADDIELPPRLRDTKWSVVSDSNPVVELAATQAYQWLGPAYAPMGNNCLLVGIPMASFSPYGRFDLDQAQPVLALSAPANSPKLQLIPQQEAQDIDAAMTDFFTEKYPWLRGYEASKHFACEDSAVKPTQLKVLPIALQTDIHITPVLGWFVSSQCEDPTFRWVLVTAKPDASYEMVAMEGTRGTPVDFFPAAAWVVDVNGDGLDEILIKAIYYEGDSFKLLKFVTAENGTHALRQIASSAYYGL
jgi:hypothetical protein